MHENKDTTVTLSVIQRMGRPPRSKNQNIYLFCTWELWPYVSRKNVISLVQYFRPVLINSNVISHDSLQKAVHEDEDIGRTSLFLPTLVLKM